MGHYINFNNSFVTWLSIPENSYGRFEIEAKCTIKNGKENDRSEYLLLAGVMACNVYAENDLIIDPAFMFQAVFSKKEFKIFRTHAIFSPEADSYGRIGEKFKKIDIHLDKCEATEILSAEEIIESTLRNERIVGMIEYYDKQSNSQIQLEFPVKHINVQKEKKQYQVETGPVTIPEKKSKGDLINNLNLAYIAFNNSDQFYFVVYKQQKTGYRKSIRFYSHLDRQAARIRLFKFVKSHV